MNSFFRRLFQLGLANDDLREREDLRRRVRLVNVLCVVCAGVGIASVPFDSVTAPFWVVAIDLVSAILFLSLPLLNRAGRYRLSRVFFLSLGNAIVASAIYNMGVGWGMHLWCFSLVAFAGMLFTASEKALLALFALVPMAGYFFAVVWGAEFFPPPQAPESSFEYFLYSSLANFGIIGFGVYFLQRTSDRAEEESRQSRANAILSEKMAALGEMSSGVVHEINTPLSVLQLGITLLGRYLESGEDRRAEMKELVEKSERTIERINAITRAIRSFSRSEEGDPASEVFVGAILEEALALSRERFERSGVELVIEVPPKGAVLTCRPVQISQVLLNLLNNAYHAVSTAVSTRDPKWVRVEVRDLGSALQLRVKDSGGGVPEEIRHKIFLPFFTTKPPGYGTGLGLSVSKNIVERHGGNLFLDVAAPHTEFVAELPKA